MRQSAQRFALYLWRCLVTGTAQIGAVSQQNILVGGALISGLIAAPIAGGLVVWALGLAALFIPVVVVVVLVALTVLLVGGYTEWERDHNQLIELRGSLAGKDTEAESIAERLCKTIVQTPWGSQWLADVFVEMRHQLIQGVTLYDFWREFAKASPWGDPMAQELLAALVMQGVIEVESHTRTKTDNIAALRKNATGLIYEREQVYKTTPLGNRVLKCLITVTATMPES
jgi:hypothetical protein